MVGGGSMGGGLDWGNVGGKGNIDFYWKESEDLAFTFPPPPHHFFSGGGGAQGGGGG